MKITLCALAILLLPSLTFAQGVRLKDLANFEGVRANDLVGYGLVVGLDGTGDGLRNSPFTEDTSTNSAAGKTNGLKRNVDIPIVKPPDRCSWSDRIWNDLQDRTEGSALLAQDGQTGNGGAKLGHGSGGIVSLRAE